MLSGRCKTCPTDWARRRIPTGRDVRERPLDRVAPDPVEPLQVSVDGQLLVFHRRRDDACEVVLDGDCETDRRQVQYLVVFLDARRSYHGALEAQRDRRPLCGPPTEAFDGLMDRTHRLLGRTALRDAQAVAPDPQSGGVDRVGPIERVDPSDDPRLAIVGTDSRAERPDEDVELDAAIVRDQMDAALAPRSVVQCRILRGEPCPDRADGDSVTA